MVVNYFKTDIEKIIDGYIGSQEDKVKLERLLTEVERVIPRTPETYSMGYSDSILHTVALMFKQGIDIGSPEYFCHSYHAWVQSRPQLKESFYYGSYDITSIVNEYLVKVKKESGMGINIVKEQIKQLAERMKKEDVPDEDLVTFFNAHRVYFMDESTKVTYDPTVLEDMKKMGYRAFVSCSCGSREDSCMEDGPGMYSQFYITPFGDVFRQSKEKQ